VLILLSAIATITLAERNGSDARSTYAAGDSARLKVALARRLTGSRLVFRVGLVSCPPE